MEKLVTAYSSSDEDESQDKPELSIEKTKPTKKLKMPSI